MGVAALAVVRQRAGAAVRRAAVALASRSRGRVRAHRPVSIPALYAALPSATRALVPRLWLPGSLLPPLCGDVHVDPGGWTTFRHTAAASHADVATRRRAAAPADAA